LILRDPDSRRALRSIVQATIVLVMLGMLIWLIRLLSSSAPDLSRIATALCLIVGLYVLLVGVENVGRAVVKVNKDGAEADIGNGNAAP
jgi:Na+-driven multidrug efflux pump